MGLGSFVSLFSRIRSCDACCPMSEKKIVSCILSSFLAVTPSQLESMINVISVPKSPTILTVSSRACYKEGKKRSSCSRGAKEAFCLCTTDLVPLLSNLGICDLRRRHLNFQYDSHCLNILLLVIQLILTKYPLSSWCSARHYFSLSLLLNSWNMPNK